MSRQPTVEDVLSSKIWAETHSGDDEPVDVMAWKLLQHWAEYHESTSQYHADKAKKARDRMDELEAGFKVEDEEAF